MTLLDLPIRRKRPKEADAAARTRRVAAPSARRSPAEDHRLPRYRLTVDQYHRMIEAGILEEGIPVELLDGRLVWKDRSAQGEGRMTVGRGHALVIEKAKELGPKFRRQGGSIRAQQPVTLHPHHEPEPDLSVVRGGPDDYADGHPGPAHILCLIEVADSSLTRDRTVKLRAYANAGIAVYVIFNLPDHVVEVYTQPITGKGRYGAATTLASKDRLTFPTATGKGVTVRVRDLLPPGR